MASLAGKVIAITGAAMGMGASAAEVLASRGAIVALADVNKEGMEKVLRSLPGSKHTADVVDVRDGKQVDAWIEKTVKTLGKLHGAANVAGVLRPPLLVTEETDDNWNFVMDVNAKGVFNCLRAQLKPSNIHDGGSIVNISSVGGMVGRATFTVYNASKWAVHGLTRAAAREAGERNIRVNAIAPGTINTAMVTDLVALGSFEPAAEQAIKRTADPKEVSYAIAFLLGDESTFVTGATYTVDGGWVA